MPPGSEGTSSPACVAATWPRSADPRGRPADGDVEHLRLGRERRRHGVEGPGSGRRLMEPFDVMNGRPDGGPSIRRSRILRLASAGASGSASRQRAGLVELQRPGKARDVREVILRFGVRLDHAGLDGGAEMWTLPGYGDHLERDNPDLRKQMAEAAHQRVLRTSSPASTRFRTTSPTRRRIGA